jgi:hypothetical protein
MKTNPTFRSGFGCLLHCKLPPRARNGQMHEAYEQNGKQTDFIETLCPGDIRHRFVSLPVPLQLFAPKVGKNRIFRTV